MENLGGWLDTMRALFWQPRLTAEQQLLQWRRDAKREGRQIERAVRTIDRDIIGIRNEITRARSRRSQADVETHQASLQRSEAAKSRLSESMGHLSALDMELRKQGVQVRLYKTFQSSASVLKMLQEMTNISALRETARTMSKAMMKQGLIDQAIDDAIAGDDEDVDDNAKAEPAKKKIDSPNPSKNDDADKLAEEYITKLRSAPKTPEEEELDKLNEQDVFNTPVQQMDK
jgi:division protein CdvB (Snf7/Vps24/ESCRT-III family)